MSNEYPTCPECGTDNVVADATVEWDKQAQRWISHSGGYYEKSGFCRDCEEEIRYFEWVSIPSTPH